MEKDCLYQLFSIVGPEEVFRSGLTFEDAVVTLFLNVPHNETLEKLP
jgi:hypothetical protein